MTDDEIISRVEEQITGYRALIAKLTARVDAAGGKGLRKQRKVWRAQIRAAERAASRLEAMLTQGGSS